MYKFITLSPIITANGSNFIRTVHKQPNKQTIKRPHQENIR